MAGEWLYTEASAAQQQVCRVAGLALHLIGELPSPKDEPPYRIEAHARELVKAAECVLPGRNGITLPSDRGAFEARMSTARFLIADASDLPSEDTVLTALLGIAGNALDALDEPVAAASLAG